MRRPLGEMSSNAATHRSHPPKLAASRLPGPSTPHKLARQTSLNGYVNGDGATRSQVPQTGLPQPLRTASKRILQPRGPYVRPAQLETDDTEVTDRNVFSAAKRRSDSLYRKSRNARGLRTPSIVSLESYLNSMPAIVETRVEAPKETEVQQPAAKNLKSRFRKRFVPRRLDLEAPQYLHANDPLPLWHANTRRGAMGSMRNASKMISSTVWDRLALSIRSISRSSRWTKELTFTRAR